MTKLINNMDSHHRFITGLAVSMFVAIAFLLSNTLEMVFIYAWVAFSLTILILDWVTFLSIHPQELRKKASLQDSSRLLIFVFILMSCVISLLTVLILIIESREKTGIELVIHVMLTIISVTCSWLLVHTIFTLRYAHLYYSSIPQKPVTTSNKNNNFKGGLQFPDDCVPDYLDFCYFSFGIGTTFQVSDVVVTSSLIRRLVFVHGIISFVFNAAIVALSINILSGLAGR